MKNITCIILAKNEEKDIRRCLQSVAFCDETIVVDDESNDRTVEIARSLGVRVFKGKLNGDFASQRNEAMILGRNDWILFVDADEEITKTLKESILKTPSTPGVGGYYLKRRDVFWGQVLRFGELRKTYTKGILRLIKKGTGTWTGLVHEEFRPTMTIGSLDGYLNHYAHESITDFLLHVNIYSTLRAKELMKTGVGSNLLSIVLYPFGKFIYTYFFALGFLDGVGGFVYSFLMSFHSFLVRAKLYQYRVIDQKKP